MVEVEGNSEPANSVIRARSTIAAEGCQSISAAGALIGAQSIRAPNGSPHSSNSQIGATIRGR